MRLAYVCRRRVGPEGLLEAAHCLGCVKKATRPTGTSDFCREAAAHYSPGPKAFGPGLYVARNPP
jgi:hypothetical protein